MIKLIFILLTKKVKKMSKKYIEYKIYLEKNECEILTSLEEYKNIQKIKIKCNQNHLSELSVDQLRCRLKNSEKDICIQCESNHIFNNLKTKIFDNTGHELISFEKGKATFQCGNCGEKNTVLRDSLLNKQRKKYCQYCNSSFAKKSEEEIREKFAKINYKVLEYENNKNVKLECDKGHVFMGVVHSYIEKGVRCKECDTPEKRKDTCQQKYGVDHTSQLQEIKDKIQQTKSERKDTYDSVSYKYFEYKKHLNEQGCNLHTSHDEYLKNKEVHITCGFDHSCYLSYKQLALRLNFSDKIICILCEDDQNFEKIKRKVFERTGHNVIALHPKNMIEFKCGNCEKISTINRKWMFSSCRKHFCRSCLNKVSLDDVIEKMEKLNLEVLKYENTTNIILKCMKDHVFRGGLANLVANRSGCPECKFDKMKKTMLEKYGVEHALQHSDIKNKMKNTCLDKYGVEYASQNFEIKNKIKQIFLDKYGVENPLQHPDIKAKIRKTCLDKYGVENPSQNLEIINKIKKSSYSSKKYIFPSGRQENIQGYEGRCIDTLLLSYSENDIVIDKIQKIPYMKIINNCEKQAYYFPDIKLPDKLIEVKSTWTYSVQKELNEIKMQATASKGYIIEMWVYDTKNILFKKRYRMIDNKIIINFI